MFGRRLNGFEDYHLNKKIVPLSREERLEARQKWIKKLDLLVNDIWLLIKEVGKVAGKKRNDQGNDSTSGVSQS